MINKKLFLFLVIIFSIQSVNSESIQEIQTNILEKKANTEEEINTLFLTSMLFIKGKITFYNDTDDIFKIELYVSKNKFHQYLYKNDELLKEYIYVEDKLWEIKDGRKDYMPEFSFQNILTFWWDSFDIEKIKFDYQVNGYYFCSYEFNDKTKCKLILDNNYELIQIEVSTDNRKYTEKITENKCIPGSNLMYPKEVSLYLDSITIQKNEFSEISRVPFNEDLFEISCYKDENFFHSFINSVLNK